MTDLEHERLRQAELDSLELDTLAETAFDDLTHAAADILGAPIATITIVDGDWHWFKSRLGLAPGRFPRAEAFSDHAIQSAEAFFVVEDASKDPRFSRHPLVTGEPHVCFYAAATLRLSSGRAIGTLDVMDSRPRKAEPSKLKRLRFMADQVVATLEARKAQRAAGRPQASGAPFSPLALAKASLQAFVDKDRSAIEALLAPDFRFTSPLDHALDREGYLRLCWPHSTTMQSVRVVHAAESGDRAFIVYEAKVAGKLFRNAEMHLVRDGRLAEVEVYFGWELPHQLARNTRRDPD